MFSPKRCSISKDTESLLEKKTSRHMLGSDGANAGESAKAARRIFGSPRWCVTLSRSLGVMTIV